MKFLALIFFTLAGSPMLYAQSAPLELIPEQRIGTRPILSLDSEGVDHKGTIDQDSMGLYLVDTCSLRDDSVENENVLRAQNLRRCRDGSVSFVQPPSEGWRGYHGKCGQTAASNLIFMSCQLAVHPTGYADHYMSDLTPGIRPNTLRRGLNEIFEVNSHRCPDAGEWETVRAGSSRNFFDLIEISLNAPNSFTRRRADGARLERSAVASLIRTPGSRELHWVTIVDLIGRNTPNCQVVINHWNSQYRVPCQTYADWSYGVADSYGPLLRAYTLVRYTR